jgi:hypothetical protein
LLSDSIRKRLDRGAGCGARMRGAERAGRVCARIERGVGCGAGRAGVGRVGARLCGARGVRCVWLVVCFGLVWWGGTVVDLSVGSVTE